MATKRDVEDGTDDRRGASTRAALVRAAGDVFVAEGYGAVSVRDLARGTGVTTGALYGHFRNKADVLVAAIGDRIEGELESPHDGKEPETISSAIARQWRNYPSRSAMRALLVEGAAAARVDDHVKSQLSKMLETKLDEWRQAWRDLQVAEHLDPEVDMDTLMLMVFAAEVGLGVLESIGVNLPKPKAWGQTADQIFSNVYPAAHY